MVQLIQTASNSIQSVKLVETSNGNVRLIQEVELARLPENEWTHFDCVQKNSDAVERLLNIVN